MQLKKSIKSDICIKKSKYWDPTSRIIDNKINSSDAIQNVENILSKVINSQIQSDVPLGVFLSGGIDSSLVTTLMQKTPLQELSRSASVLKIKISTKLYFQKR